MGSLLAEIDRINRLGVTVSFERHLTCPSKDWPTRMHIGYDRRDGWHIASIDLPQGLSDVEAATTLRRAVELELAIEPVATEASKRAWRESQPLRIYEEGGSPPPNWGP